MSGPGPRVPRPTPGALGTGEDGRRAADEEPSGRTRDQVEKSREGAEERHRAEKIIPPSLLSLRDSAPKPGLPEAGVPGGGGGDPPPGTSA